MKNERMEFSRWPAVAALGLILISAGAGAQDRASGKTVIRNVRVFDGENVMPRASVVVENGLIKAVAPDIEPPPGAEVVDGTGKTLLPGLIDSHVHVWEEDKLRQAPVFGVTVLVDMFTSVEFVSGIKKIQAGPGPHPQAFLVSSQTVVTVAGGHCTEYGLIIPTLQSAAEAQSFVDARIAEGSDFIKIIYDNGEAYQYRLPTLSLEEFRAVIRAARDRHKLSIVHAGSLKKCIEALEAGADGLAHLNFDDAFDADFGRLAASKKAFVIPTLSVLAAMNGRPDAAGIASDKRLKPFLKPDDIQLLRRTVPYKVAPAAYAEAERALKQLRDARVPILAGTDTSNPGTAFGASLHGELELLVQAGLTPLEALRSATSVPADIFGIKNRGRIKAGCAADLVLVEGDPTSEIEATRAIISVWKDGMTIDRESYRRNAETIWQSLEEQQKAAPPSSLGTGIISDFEGETISSAFGSGWVVSTDSIMGGKSTAEMALAGDGAEGSRKSLRIKGMVAEGGSFQWAGAMFMPGAAAMAAANLASFKRIGFWAKGEGPAFAVMVFCQSTGFIPRIERLEVTPEWKDHSIAFEKLGIDGHDILGIFIGATNAPGKFSLNIDNVRLK